MYQGCRAKVIMLGGAGNWVGGNIWRGMAGDGLGCLEGWGEGKGVMMLEDEIACYE